VTIRPRRCPRVCTADPRTTVVAVLIVPDRQLDPQLQQVWGQCDPLTEVQFAVVPAYHVNGRVYAKQQVFTKRRRSWLPL